MSSQEYRNALENMHKLVDELEDVTIENQVLHQENIELEKDVNFIAEKHNETVEGIKQLANNTRNYRINSRMVNNQANNCNCNCGCNCKNVVEQKQCNCNCGCNCKNVVEQKQCNCNCHDNVKEQCQCNCNNCNPQMNIDTSGLLSKITNKLSILKNKSIFIIALLLVIMLAIGASPSNAISWKAFSDLYIEFICNPATMAMAVALVVLLYKGIIKRKK